jgi:arylsulfatase A
MRFIFTTFILVCCCTCVVPAAEERERPPNIVLIFTDDQGYADVGVYGAKGFETPNLDRLAAEGRRFTDFYVAQPVCSASRTALLTGCYPNRIGIHGALGPGARHGIHSNEVTLAELLKPQGYATAIFGKWHLGHHPEFLPKRHGFDEYFGLPYSNDMWPHHPTATFPDLPLIEGETILEYNPDQRKLTTQCTERAVRFIEENRDEPFFLYVPHPMPHVPLFVSDKHSGVSEQGLYGDVIREIDWSVGEIMKALEREGLEERTWVMFISDNGPWLSYGDHAGSAGPLREGKGTVWEGGVRVPCIMRWPGRIPAGTVCREPVMTIDLLPTLAHVVNAAPPGHRIDGRNVWPLIAGEAGAASPHDAYFFYYARNELQALRSGPWKLILPHTYRTLAGKPGGEEGMPVPYEQVRVGLELYHLGNDVGETRNVIEDHPRVKELLLALAEQARVELGDTLTERQGAGVREPGRLPAETGVRNTP